MSRGAGGVGAYHDVVVVPSVDMHTGERSCPAWPGSQAANSLLECGACYPVHPYRHSMAAESRLVNSDGVTHSGFRWLVDIDGVMLEIDGGFWEDATTR